MYSCNYKPDMIRTNKFIFISIIFTLAISFIVTSYTSAHADDFKQNSTNQTTKHHLSTSQLTATECEKKYFKL